MEYRGFFPHRGADPLSSYCVAQWSVELEVVQLAISSNSEPTNQDL